MMETAGESKESSRVVMNERYVPPDRVPAVDLGYGTALNIFHWDRKERTQWMTKWVDPEGNEIWLSPRQLQCLALSLQHGSDETAFLLGLSVKTVKNHLTLLYKKLGAYNRWEAATMLGWVRLPPELLVSD